MARLGLVSGGIGVVVASTLASAHADRAVPSAGSPLADPAAPPGCRDGAPYDAARLRREVTYLASPALDGRRPGTDGDRAARAWVIERFSCLGLRPAFDDGYEQPVADGTASTANVIGFVEGERADEIVVVSAHLDHLGGGYLGANDNASGVAALLAVAETIASAPRRPNRTIAFAVFAAEEGGMKGSYHYARNPSARLPVTAMVQVINLDMVGSYRGRGFVAAMGTFRGLAATRHLAALDDAFPKLHVATGGRARGSDYEPFCEVGVPYVFFWTPDPRCYHKKCDTADRLDYREMADIAKLAGNLTASLASTDDDLMSLRTKRGCGLPRRN